MDNNILRMDSIFISHILLFLKADHEVQLLPRVKQRIQRSKFISKV